MRRFPPGGKHTSKPFFPRPVGSPRTRHRLPPRSASRCAHSCLFRPIHPARLRLHPQTAGFCVHAVRCIAGRDRAKLCQRVLQLRLVSRLVLSVGLDHDQSARLPLALDRNAAEIPDLINQRQRIPDDLRFRFRLRLWFGLWFRFRGGVLLRGIVRCRIRRRQDGRRHRVFAAAAPGQQHRKTEQNGYPAEALAKNPVVPSSHTASLLKNASKCVVFIAPGFGEFVNRFPHFRVQSFSCDFVKIAGCVPSAG